MATRAGAGPFRLPFPELPQNGGHPMAEHGALSRGHVRQRLVMDLAADLSTRAALAREYGCSRAAISQFAARHQWDISRARENLEDRYAALWAAGKVARVATHQEVI